MPGVENACFISYKHPPDVSEGPATSVHFWMEFIKAFQQRLESYLTVNRKIYRDHALKSVPGALYPQELSRQLCRSACLIAILVPEYLESSWCRAEWKAMEELAQKRVAAGDGRAYIIPVLFRGDKGKAEEFAGERVVVDFRDIWSPGRELGSIASRKAIASIAAQVDAVIKRLNDIEPCDEFRIDVGPEQVEPASDDPNPLI